MPVVTFGGNAATIKTRRNHLKKKYENFTASSSEVLDQTFDRLQKLISRLEIHGESISQEDVNQKFLRSLSPEWKQTYIVWRNKPDQPKQSTVIIEDLQQINLMIRLEMDLRWRGYANNEGKEILEEHWKKADCEWAPRNQENRYRVLGFKDCLELYMLRLELLVVKHNLVTDQGVIGSGCSRHMTGNMSYLTVFEEIDGGYVAFGGNPKGGKITGSGTIKTAELLNKGVLKRKNRTLLRVLVTKPHNKTPYELFLGRKPALGFMRPFGCPVTILNTIDHLGKFDGKADEGFFIGNLINSKAFIVFNSRTWIVEENMHVQFSENTPNTAGSGPNWLFDIDALTKSMNYKPVVAGNHANGNVGTKACDDAGKARMKTVPGKDYICYHCGLLIYHSLKIQRVLLMLDSNLQEIMKRRLLKNQEKKVVIPKKRRCSNEVNAVGAKTSIELLVDPNILALEDNNIFNFSSDDEDVGAEADMNNLDAFIPVSPIPTIRVHKDHPVEQIIGDLNSAPQTRRMTKNLEEHEPKEVIQALQDPSWIEAMQDELL
ncbi:retrovirus-related pol polyprotein from transposon TNT 1-94 [Tanacetum coccineum]